MAAMFLVSFALLPFLADPAPSLTRGKAKSRNLECERLTAESGSQSRPGQIEASRPRGDFAERSVMVCSERLMRPGLRPERDEAVLATLDARTRELATAALSLRPDLEARTWLVEVFYPSAQVSAKIAFAAKNALMGQGLGVSDRLVTLAVGDVAVLTRMAPEEAYPAACRRYLATGSLGEDDALLAVVSLDPRETQLHAGLCTRGQWTWLR